MRLFLASCLLLAATANISASLRQKRDLLYLKELIVSKLFGEETIFIQLPELPKNETTQLFKVQGHDDFLIKVIRKTKKNVIKDKLPPKADPVIVSPEIAIIGSYLGTTTQGETLLAIEVAKNLIKLGILNSKRDKLAHKTEVTVKTPQLSNNDYIVVQPERHINIYTEESEPLYVIPPQQEVVEVVEPNPVPVFQAEVPSFVIASEVKVRPVQTKYSYLHKGENADMRYESYNNRDVIVTRTVKEPPLPQYIKVRFADVASIAANPFLVRSQLPIPVATDVNYVQPMQVASAYNYPNPVIVKEHIGPVSIPTYIINSIPTHGTEEKPTRIVASNINSPLYINKDDNPSTLITAPRFIKHPRSRDNETLTNFNEIMSTKQHKVREQTKNVSNPAKIRNSVVPQVSTPKTDQKDTSLEENLKGKEAVTSNSIVTKYSYKQMNNNSHNFTVVEVEDQHKFKLLGESPETNATQSVEEVPKNYLYIPPDIDLPLPNVIQRKNVTKNKIFSKINKSKDNVSSTENYPKINFNRSERKPAIEVKGQLRTNDHSLKTNPIVVQEYLMSNSEENLKGESEGYQLYPGGPVF